jgi:hypothetical protein
MTKGWTVRGSNPGGGEIFRTCPDRPWGPPSLLYNGYRVFPGGKLRPGRGADHSPPSNADVMEEKSYNCTHPLGHTGPVTGLLYLYWSSNMESTGGNLFKPPIKSLLKNFSLAGQPCILTCWTTLYSSLTKCHKNRNNSLVADIMNYYIT